MDFSYLDRKGTKRRALGKIVHEQDIKHDQPMKYVGANGLNGVIICRRMERGERHGHDDPVLVGIDAVYKNNDHGNDQVEQQETPTFADLDQELAEVLLNVETADNERDDKPGHTKRNPDGFGKRRHIENDPGYNIGPGPMPGKIEEEEQEVVGK